MSAPQPVGALGPAPHLLARDGADLALEIAEYNAFLLERDPTAGTVDPTWWIQTNPETRAWLRALWRANVARWATETGAERVARYAEEDREAARIRWVRFARMVGLPERFEDASFETAAKTASVQTAESWWRTRARVGGCLILAGATGVGKTYAAACVMRTADGWARVFVPFTTFKRTVFDREERREMLERAMGCALLVMDDLDADDLKENKWVRASAEEVLFARYEHRRATILTTNATMEELAKGVSARLMDRFREWGRWEQLEGKSLRGLLEPELDGLR